jgi:diguanylate cyclase (GGDEF)-like protein
VSEHHVAPSVALDDGPGIPVGVWKAIVWARYAAIVALLAIVALTHRSETDQRTLIVLAAVLVPYAVGLHLFLRRTGQQPAWSAVIDELALISILAAFPELLPAALALIVACNALAAIVYGRGVGLAALIAGGAVGALVIQVRVGSEELAQLGVALAMSAFLVAILGTLAEQSERLRYRHQELMAGIDAIVWEQLSRRPSTLWVSRRAEELLGYPVDEWRQPGFWRAHVHPDDVEQAARQYREAIRRGTSRELEYRMIDSTGRTIHVCDRMQVRLDPLGRPVEVRGVMFDVTGERRATAQAEQYLNLVDRIALALLVLRLENLHDDRSLTIVALNPETGRLAATDPRTATGHPVGEVLPMIDERLTTALANVVRTGKPFLVDDLRSDDGTRSRIHTLFAFPLPDQSVGVSIQDITDRTMAAEVLRRQALHDALTGLPNRTMLNERLHQAIRTAARDGRPAALVVMDLDQFKEVNDALGHDHGDRLLIEVSRRLQKVLQGADTIARLGGDEFAALLSDTDEEAARRAASQIRSALEQPFQLGGIDIQTSASIGIAMHPEHGADADTLVQRADVAMYTAKRGNGGAAVYSPEHDQSSVRRLSLLGELRRAIAEDELELYYQPCLTLPSGTIGSAEALVRWNHPRHGVMPPGEFIELAEISGMIQPLTHWVIESAVTQIKAWRDAGHELVVSVNLSVRNLYDPELVPSLQRVLTEHEVPAELLKLEVTESELMDDPLQAMDVLGELKSMGSATSIDDFGTGYSSLAYLKHLPIDELKIDRSFVATMTVDESDLTIVRSTIDLSHNLGLSVVAEGVEDLETLRRLADLGCDRAQGYYITRPMPAAQCTEWLGDAAARSALSGELADRASPP